MGDILALVDQAQQLVDAKEQARLQAQLEKGQFSLEDFRDQIEKFARPGLMQKMLSLLPGMGQLRELMGSEDSTKEIRRMVGVIDSMTPNERRNPKIIDPSRRRRIASGAGVPPQLVGDLIKQFDTLKPMMTGMASSSGSERMQMMEELREQMLDPARNGPKTKKGTGTRLTAKEREKRKKQREKFCGKNGETSGTVGRSINHQGRTPLCDVRGAKWGLTLSTINTTCQEQINRGSQDSHETNGTEEPGVLPHLRNRFPVATRWTRDRRTRDV
jgi:hypothetical protein